MKTIITSLLLAITSITLAQKDLGLKEKNRFYETYISDDGSFAINDGRTIYSYDPEGNKLAENKNHMMVSAYDPGRNLWFSYELHHGKFTVMQMDINGNEIKTDIKNKYITGDQVEIILDETVNFYITSTSENLLPLVVVKYNPNNKTSQVINFRDIPGIKGKVVLIGERNKETYFANYTDNKTKKNGFDVKIYAVNDKRELRLVETIKFADTPELIWYIALKNVSPLNNAWGENLYFAINAYTSASGKPDAADKSTTKIVYQIDQEDKYSVVNLYLSSSVSGAHLPLKFIETEENLFFVISDDLGTRIVYSADFSSSEVSVFAFKNLRVENLMFYHEQYPELFKIGQDNTAGAFKVCGGMARLITIKNGAGTFYSQEAVK